LEKAEALEVEVKKRFIDVVKDFLDKISRSERETLELLCQHDKLTTNEISLKLKKIYPQVSRDLNSLKRKGLITSTRDGRKKYYKIKEEYTTLFVAVFAADYAMEALSSAIDRIRSNPDLTDKEKARAVDYLLENFDKRLQNYCAEKAEEAINYVLEKSKPQKTSS